MVTDKSSKSYKTLQRAENKDGLYHIDGFICVAMSGYYGTVGDKFRITLSSNQVFYAIMSDTKKKHELTKQAHPDGSVIEFIVDVETLPKQVRLEGSLNSIFNGKIEKIERMK